MKGPRQSARQEILARSVILSAAKNLGGNAGGGQVLRSLRMTAPSGRQEELPRPRQRPAFFDAIGEVE